MQSCRCGIAWYRDRETTARNALIRRGGAPKPKVTSGDRIHKETAELGINNSVDRSTVQSEMLTTVLVRQCTDAEVWHLKDPMHGPSTTLRTRWRVRVRNLEGRGPRHDENDSKNIKCPIRRHEL